MNEQEMSEFTAAMQSEDASVENYLEALIFAMESVSRVPTYRHNRAEARYFGKIAGGTFYADGNPEDVRWYPDTDPTEAIVRLELEFGEAFIGDLEDRLFGE